ncbi:hypothetical protein EJ03DRAFT_370819 [Teratosphaeria nubilosa]|uniref:Cardiolipin synthase N-terminal domain-containing protein n=1 Tax=Teratosphaeria nubilosa TaxID=161662 RepID=A0A6G1LM20_9PEZI|nr:hypothetical protein EJ03DRAFT_370819 [Teratosphaeria nubilosa]
MFSVFLQLCLAALTFAAPIADGQATVMGMNPAQQYGTGGGVLGFIVLILDIIVWVEVLKSNRPPSHKILWSLLVFLFPVVGVIIYWLFSDRQKWNAGAGGYEPIA